PRLSGPQGRDDPRARVGAQSVRPRLARCRARGERALPRRRRGRDARRLVAGLRRQGQGLGALRRRPRRHRRRLARGTRMTVQLGAVFPQTEIGEDPARVRAFAQGVQELGFHHLMAYDHVLGAERERHQHLVGPYRAEHEFHEILVLFGYLAAIVPGLELVTGVIIAPQRQTALVAKQTAEVDILTGGRFRCGLGIGWNDVEYEALGMDFTNRGRRFEEQIELLRRFWTEPVFDFDGRWHKV